MIFKLKCLLNVLQLPTSIQILCSISGLECQHVGKHFMKAVLVVVSLHVTYSDPGGLVNNYHQLLSLTINSDSICTDDSGFHS